MDYSIKLDVEETKNAIKKLNKILLMPNYILSVVFLICSVFVFLSYWLISNDIIFIISGSVIFACAIAMTAISLYQSNKSVNNIKYGISYEYRFMETSVLVKVENEKTNGTNNINYDEFIKARGNDEYIYLFINKNQAYLLKKQSLSDEIKTLIKSKIKKTKGID